jgi:hypothetical protein
MWKEKWQSLQEAPAALAALFVFGLLSAVNLGLYWARRKGQSSAHGANVCKR